MKKYVNGEYIDMTADEIAAMQEAAARAEAEEKRRPYTIGEVSEMLIRQQINTLSVDDAVAIRIKDFYPVWETGKAYTTANGCPVGYKITRNGRLWKLRQEHTSQDNWAPGETGTESLWEEICEQHDGTKYDPIPYRGGHGMIYFVPGMHIEEGMRYTDGIRRYIAIRSGQALSLTDEYYFEAL